MATSAASVLATGNAAGGGTPPAGNEGQGGTPPAATPPAGTEPPATGEKPWYEAAGVDPKYKTAIEAKGWTNPNDILDSYTNIEKLVGGKETDRFVIKPKDDASPEELAAFREKAGFAAPKEAAEYGFAPEQITGRLQEAYTKSGLKPELAEVFTAETAPELAAAANWMHKAGTPKDIADGIAQAYIADKLEGLKAFTQQSDEQYRAFAREMGDKLPDFEEAGRRAFRASGLSKPMLDKMEMAIGTKAMMEMFGKFGGAMGEAQAPMPPKTPGGGQFTMTQPQAAAKIAAYRQDADFQARLFSPNPALRKTATDEWEALHKAAYPA